MAKHKYIESPEKMWELFCAYREEINNNPILIVEQKKGNTIIPKNLNVPEGQDITKLFEPLVYLPKQRPLTMEGFENYCFDNGIINDLGDYFSNKDGKYSDYSTICSRIKKVIRQEQIEGGMSGIYNSSITQRLNGLTEKQEVSGNINLTHSKVKWGNNEIPV